MKRFWVFWKSRDSLYHVMDGNKDTGLGFQKLKDAIDFVSVFEGKAAWQQKKFQESIAPSSSLSVNGS